MKLILKNPLNKISILN